MKVLNRLGIFLLLSGLLWSCSSSLTFRGRQNLLSGVEAGMTKEEILKLLGEPDFRRFDGNFQEWEYRKVHALTGEKTIVFVNFERNRVVSVDSYDGNTPPYPHPEVLYPPVLSGEEYDTSAYPPVYSPADDRYFRSLYKDIGEAYSPEESLAMLKDAVSERFFTVMQCMKILDTTSFGEERLQYLRVLAPVISDMENGGKLIDTFTFESERKEAQKILLEQSVNRMSDDNLYLAEMEKRFRFLYGEMKKTTFDSERIELLTFAVKTQYFTCSQCVQLLKFCDFDDDRMEYLKRLAPRILDYQNSEMLVDLMDFSKEEAKRMLQSYEREL